MDPGARKETLERVEQGVLIESGRDLASESAAIRSLEGLGLIRSLGVELPDGGAWLRFMGRDVPRLLEQGWRIEVAESERRRWLDVGLGVDVDGERLDLLPLLVDLVQRYQADFSLPTLARMEDEETLQVRLEAV